MLGAIARERGHAVRSVRSPTRRARSRGAPRVELVGLPSRPRAQGEEPRSPAGTGAAPRRVARSRRRGVGARGSRAAADRAWTGGPRCSSATGCEHLARGRRCARAPALDERRPQVGARRRRRAAWDGSPWGARAPHVDPAQRATTTAPAKLQRPRIASAVGRRPRLLEAQQLCRQLEQLGRPASTPVALAAPASRIPRAARRSARMRARAPHRIARRDAHGGRRREPRALARRLSATATASGAPRLRSSGGWFAPRPRRAALSRSCAHELRLSRSIDSTGPADSLASAQNPIAR